MKFGGSALNLAPGHLQLGCGRFIATELNSLSLTFHLKTRLMLEMILSAVQNTRRRGCTVRCGPFLIDAVKVP